MLLLLFFLSFTSELCHSQMVYSRMVPYDPRYLMHRPPVRRSAMDALERLRLPITRYFAQVDNQAAPAPYQVAPGSFSGYQLPPEEVYALPPQWTDELVVPERNEDEASEFDNFEYDNGFAPPVYRPSVFADEVYAPQEPVADPIPENDYNANDFMANYFMGGSEPVDTAIQSESYDLQRRSGASGPRNQGVITLSSILEANKSPNSNEATPVPPAPIPSQVPPQVQMTAVPSAPEKKEMKSLVIPAPIVEPRDEIEDPWRAVGQKEEPLFRPLQNSQRTTWEVLTRAKNSVQKRPIPLLKKMIQHSQPNQEVVDPLTEELKNLKKEHRA